MPFRARGRVASAIQTFTSLPAHYAPYGWTSLEAFMLMRSLDLQETSEKLIDENDISVLRSKGKGT